MEENRTELENEVDVETVGSDDSYESTLEDTSSDGGLETILIIGAAGAVVGAVVSKVIMPKVKKVGKKIVSKGFRFVKGLTEQKEENEDSKIVEGKAEEKDSEE